MEKRLLLFFALSMLVLIGYQFAQNALVPPPPPAAEDADPGAGDAADGDAAQVAGGGASPDDQPPSPATAALVRNANQEAAQVEAAASQPKQWLTLRSPKSPLSVRFVNHGAGVDSMELVGVDAKGRLEYRALDDTRPYWGAVVLDDGPDGGALVRYVEPGCPADEAGLEEGDVILAVGMPGDEQDPILEEKDLHAFLATKRYRGAIALELLTAKGGDINAAPKKLVAAIAERPFALIRPDRDQDWSLLETPAAFRVELTEINGKALDSDDPRHRAISRDMLEGAWEMVERSQTHVAFRKTLAAKLLEPFAVDGAVEVTKTFQMAESEDPSENPANHLSMRVAFKNQGSQPITIAYALHGASGLSTEGWWYQNKLHPRLFSVAGARDVATLDQYGNYRLISARQLQSQSKKSPATPEISLFDSSQAENYRTVSALAGDCQYFSVALIPADFAEEKVQAIEFAEADAVAIGYKVTERHRLKLQNNTFRAVTVVKTVEAHGAYSDDYALFCGPKKPHLLAKYDLQNLIYHGWFGAFSQLAGWLLAGFYSVVGNYGVAIILLTIVVRGALYPLGRRAALSARKMQELQPEMKAIREKYKEDLQRQQQELNALYKKHKFNPLGGCGPSVLQLPVFLGLYRCLAVDIDLRQAALIPGLDWCSNLAGPDQLWNWSPYLMRALAGEGDGWLGPYLNVLPIITICLFLLQQKLFTPPATDETTRTQQQLMKYMMAFFCVMFFRVPAGLCLYFITSTIWAIAERQLLPKPNPDAKSAKETKLEQAAQKTIEQKKARKRAANRRR